MITGAITNIRDSTGAMRITVGDPVHIYVSYKASTDNIMDYPGWYTRLVAKADGLEDTDEQFHTGYEGDRNDNLLSLGVMPNRSISGTVRLERQRFPGPILAWSRGWDLISERSFVIAAGYVPTPPPPVVVPIAPSLPPPTYPWEPTTPTPTPTPIISPAPLLAGFNWTTMLLVGGVALLAFMILTPQKGKKAAKTKG